MNIDHLSKILEGDISLIEQLDQAEVAFYEDRVVIYPHHVKTILKRYLNEELNVSELNAWARFICSRMEYSSPDFLDDEKVTFYEDMWYVIQKLSTPEIDGELTNERIEEYLKELEKYPD